MGDNKAELKVGEVVVRAEGSGVVLSMGDSGQNLHLDAEHLPDLINFFASLAPSPSERRIGFRIPVAKMDPNTRDDLQMEITLDGRTWSVQPVDFSLTGVLVETDERPAEGADLELSIDFMGMKSKMRAKVVRLLGENKVAMHFPSTLRDGELDPPDSLIGVYRKIEGIWLKQRMKFD